VVRGCKKKKKKIDWFWSVGRKEKGVKKLVKHKRKNKKKKQHGDKNKYTYRSSHTELHEKSNGVRMENRSKK